jgi:hypothetical protein
MEGVTFHELLPRYKSEKNNSDVPSKGCKARAPRVEKKNYYTVPVI